MNPLSTEDTTVVATYSNRHDAEVARSLLEDRGIASFVVADEVHPPIQLTGGVRLLVLSGEAQEARQALEDAALQSRRMSAEEDVRREQDRYEGWGYSIARPAGITRWLYTTTLILLLAAMTALILFGTIA